jgi:hypothetical protein
MGGKFLIINESADNLSGGSLGDIPYQESIGITTFLKGSSASNGQVITWNGSVPVWNDASSDFSVTDDTSTDFTYYPVFVNATTGIPTQISVSSTNLNFNPSTGKFSAKQFASLSDRSKKTNINQIKNPIDIVKQLNGVTFNWIDNNHASMGLIAQDVEKIVPEVVTSDSKGIKSVSYSNLVAVLIEAIKKQQYRIEELENKINA